MNMLANFALAAGLMPLGLMPPNGNADLRYPTSIDLVSNYASMDGWQRNNGLTIERGVGVPQFSYGTAYLAVSATASYDDNGVITLQSVRFAEFKASSGGFSAGYAIQQSWNVAFPWSFAFLTPSTGYFNLYEYGAYVMGQYDDWLKFDVESISYTRRSKGVECNAYYVNNTSGPYPLLLNVSSADVLDKATPYLANYFYSAQEDYQQGYRVGFEEGWKDGDESGYNRGYAVGYQDGSDASATGSVVANLFGAVIGVPIGILNGFTPFVIWDVPIVSILITFLFAGIIIWVVKKFI